MGSISGLRFDWKYARLLCPVILLIHVLNMYNLCWFVCVSFFSFSFGFFVTLVYSVGCSVIGHEFEQSSSSDGWMSIIVVDDAGQSIFSLLADGCFCVPTS